MTVATFAAALTSGIVFALPTSDTTSDNTTSTSNNTTSDNTTSTSNTTTCNNCDTVRKFLSVAFLFFTLSLFTALFVRIAVRTQPDDPKNKWWLYLNQAWSHGLMVVSAVFLAVGFIFVGVGLICIGQEAIGIITCGMVGIFIIFLIVLFCGDKWKSCKDKRNQPPSNTEEAGACKPASPATRIHNSLEIQ
jgi:hypothetical protein